MQRWTILILVLIGWASGVRADVGAADSPATPAVDPDRIGVTAHSGPPTGIWPHGSGWPATGGAGYTFDTHRADTHAPIGVMGDHAHQAGELMLSYRYMRMEMDGNRDGGERVGNQAVLDQFMVTPTEMTMEMHMFGAMYAPTEWVTLMAMVPYVRMEMDHVTGGGMRFTTRSEGIGDAKLTGMFPVFARGHHYLQMNVGLSFPTGSIDEKDATPADPTASNNLPYPMQLGSGTYDLRPSVTYVYQIDRWSWGNQLAGVVRLGRNGNGYTLGDRFEATSWLAYTPAAWVSVSGRLAYSHWGNIDGRDDGLNPMMVPTARTDLREGERLDLMFGVNLHGHDGWLAGHRLAVEVGFPVHQYLDGPQLETDLLLTAGWQYAF